MPGRRKILLVIVSLLFLAMLFGEGFPYNDMWPIPPGTSENFWAAATDVHLGEAQEIFGTASLSTPSSPAC